jgi:hypothetical protein
VNKKHSDNGAGASVWAELSCESKPVERRVARD